MWIWLLDAELKEKYHLDLQLLSALWSFIVSYAHLTITALMASISGAAGSCCQQKKALKTPMHATWLAPNSRRTQLARVTVSWWFTDISFGSWWRPKMELWRDWILDWRSSTQPKRNCSVTTWCVKQILTNKFIITTWWYVSVVCTVSLHCPQVGKKTPPVIVVLSTILRYLFFCYFILLLTYYLLH